jgi:hypothetical protein
MTQDQKDKLSRVRKERGFRPWNEGKRFPQVAGDKNPAKRLEVRRKISATKMGVMNPNWKGGISRDNLRIRASSEYRLWREAVFKRDGYRCIWCRAKNGNGVNVVLHADHIKQFAFYPELRFAIDNGRTLCRECHKTTDTYRTKKKI